MKIISRISSQLSAVEKLAISAIVLLRLALVVFDLAGIYLVGIVVTIVSGTSTPVSQFQSALTQVFGVNILNLDYVVLAVLAISFFVFKGLLSTLLTHAAGIYMANLETKKAATIYERIMKSKLESLDGLSPHELSHGTIQAVNLLISQSLTYFTQIISEFALLIAISIMLFLTDSTLFVVILIFFGIVGYIMFLVTTKFSVRAAYKSHKETLILQNLISGSISNIRQIQSSRVVDNFVYKFQEHRAKISRQSATYATLTTLPRYITEIAVMVGVGLLISQRYAGVNGPVSAATIAVFLAGIFRIVASMLPIQSSITQLRRIGPEASIAFELLESLPVNFSDKNSTTLTRAPSVKVEALSFSYGPNETRLFENVSFEIPAGIFCAIVGPSGQGKSTLADIILGLRTDYLGKVKINGKENLTSPQMAYVPQNPTIFEGSLLENVTLSFSSSLNESLRLKVLKVLNQVELGSLVTSMENGIDTQIGFGHRTLSGGQIQRIGLARALLRDPKLLVLDEVTSALDKETESAITKVIFSIRKKTTILVIAHRESTIAGADLILKVDKRKVSVSRKL